MGDTFGHSLLGGSGAKRWLKCAGSYLLASDQQASGELEDNSSEYAQLGSAAHVLAAGCLEHGREPFDYLGVKYDGFTVGKEIELDAISIYVNECRSIMASGEGRVLIEGQLHHKEVHPALKGTVDFAFYIEKSALILRDYKHGEGIAVPAYDNDQLKYYAYLCLLEWPDIRDHPEMIVSLGIVQPRYNPAEPVDVWETTVSEIAEYGDNVLLPRMQELSVGQDIDEEDFVPGDWCQFCPVLLECPKLSEAFEMFASMEVEPEMLTDEELSALYEKKEAARRYMTALENTVKSRLIAGREISAAKLVYTRPTRSWKEEAEAALVAELGDNAYTKSLKSPAQVEKLSSRGKALALEWGYTPESTNLTVASADDKRPAAKPQTGADTFAAFGSSEYEGF